MGRFDSKGTARTEGKGENRKVEDFIAKSRGDGSLGKVLKAQA